MYVDVKMSKKGEIVIPVFVRKQFKLQEGGSVRLEVEKDSVRFVTPKKDVVSWMREHAEKHGKHTSEILLSQDVEDEMYK